MKKLLILPLSLVLLLMSFVCFVSCTEEVDKEINTITDFSNFSSLTRATDRIEVTFDNHSGAPFYFTIEDKEDIDEIMDIIFSSSFQKRGKEMNDGDHTSIKIIQGENEYRMSVVNNKDGQYYYSFSTTEIQDKIIELAREAGAYNK